MKKWLGYAGLVLVFGSGFLFLNIASRQVSPLELTAIRLLVSSVALVIMVYATGQSFPRSRREWYMLIGLGVVNYTIPFTLFTWAQQQGVDSGLTGVLSALSPLFTALMAHYAFSDERMTIYTIIGVVIGLAGVVILASRNLQVAGTLWGIGAVVLAAFSLASSNIYSRVLMGGADVENARFRYTPLMLGAGTSIGGTLVTGALVLVGFALGNAPSPYGSLQTDVIVAILALTFVHTLVPSVLVRFVIRSLGASVMSTTQYLVPVIALLLGAVFRDEIIDLRVMVGTVVILLGVAIANFGGAWIATPFRRAVRGR